MEKLGKEDTLCSKEATPPLPPLAFFFDHPEEGPGCMTVFHLARTATFGDLRKKIINILGGGFPFLVYKESDHIMRTPDDDVLLIDNADCFPGGLKQPCRVYAARGCDGCGGSKATKFCKGCHRAGFCSPECQSLHWKAGHKFSCSGTKTKEELQRVTKEREGLTFTIVSMAERIAERDNIIKKLSSERRQNTEKDVEYSRLFLDHQRTTKNLEELVNGMEIMEGELLRLNKLSEERSLLASVLQQRLEWAEEKLLLAASFISPYGALELLSDFVADCEEGGKFDPLGNGSCEDERGQVEGSDNSPRSPSPSRSGHLMLLSSSSSSSTLSPEETQLTAEVMGNIVERLGSLLKISIERLLNMKKGRCIICQEGPSEYASSDCGHLSLCSGCVETTTLCPVCRKDVKSPVRIFTST